MKYLPRTFEFETFSWSVVQQLHHLSQLFCGDQIEVERLWKILPQESIRILIRPTLPCMVGICEIHLHAALHFNTFPIGKLGSVVERECPAFLFGYAPESLKRKR